MATTSNNLFYFFLWKIREYLALTKPRLVALLFLTALVEGLSLHFRSPDSFSLLVLMVSVLLSCMGTNAMTCYFDRDIDRIMSRTKNRPLPKNSVSENSAIIFSTILLVTGIGTTLFLNIYVTFWGLMGAVFVLSYNYRIKRISPYNILIASPGGAAPVLGAYSAMTGHLISLESLLLALLIIFWTPIHIWSLAIFYGDDYRKAGVPMLPVVKREKVVDNLIVVFAVLYVLDALFVFVYMGAIMVSLFLFGMLTFPLLKVIVKSIRASSKSLQYTLFKLSGPHLGAVFVAYLLFSIFF